MIESEISQKLTLHAKKSLKEAENIAIYQNSTSIKEEHLLFGIFLEKGSLGSNILNDLGIKRTAFNKIIQKSTTAKKINAALSLSKEVKQILTKAYSLASKLDYPYVGTEHLVYSLLESTNPKIKKILGSSNKNVDKKSEKNDSSLKLDKLATESSLDDLFSGLSRNINIPNIPNVSLSKSKLPKSETPHLDHFCTNLNKEVRKRNEVIIGREKEIERITNTLNRKNKNNPLLIGDPGVGKTAIVMGLAQRINNGNVPNRMLNKKILSLDIGLIVAGTSFRGEFENRLKEIIKEATENKNIILFIDEIHSIIGAGNVNGGLDAANILKPALAQGDIHCIGASTLDEYKKYIEKDPALERRFQSILVQEPSIEETIKMLEGVSPSYENHHNVTISKEAISESVNLSTRYIQDRFLPDKALDLIDETASRIRNQQKSSAIYKKIKELKEKRDQLSFIKSELIDEENYDQAIKIRKKEDELSQEIIKLKNRYNQEEKRKKKIIISKDEIAKTISLTVGVPLEKLLSQNSKKLQQLEKKLNSQIIGQDRAVKTITDVLIRSHSGISNPEKPTGSFLFLGPSGVGKTLTAKLLAKHFFDDSDAFIRIDMSEFMERHHISQLIGSPAGYVGYGEGGKLTEKVRKKPYSLILFDEIEKAHPDTFNLLLQILEDGQLTDAEGKKINFKNSVIILTSNLGTDKFIDASQIGFSEKQKLEKKFATIKSEVLKELSQKMKPELLNRLDHTIVFNSLEKKEIKKIVRLELKNLKKRLADKGLNFTYTPKVIEMLAQKSISLGQGARYVRKSIQDIVENEVAKAIIDEKIKDKQIELQIEKDEIVAV